MEKTLDFGVEVRLGGGSYRLAYPICALMALEKHYGFSFAAQTAELKLGSLDDLVTWCWAGLLHQHPEITREEVAGMAYPRDMEALSAAIALAVAAAMPQGRVQEAGGRKQGNAKANGRPRGAAADGAAVAGSRGPKSGPSVATTSD